MSNSTLRKYDLQIINEIMVDVRRNVEDGSEDVWLVEIFEDILKAKSASAGVNGLFYAQVFTILFPDGQSDIVHGETPESAMKAEGYLCAFSEVEWEKGDVRSDWEFNETFGEWSQKR